MVACPPGGPSRRRGRTCSGPPVGRRTPGGVRESCCRAEEEGQGMWVQTGGHGNLFPVFHFVTGESTQLI